MEGMFRQIGIYAPFGQKYRPQDADQLLYYREAEDGQVLQVGISEAGGVSAWIAAGTSYSVSNVPMLPFFIFYSFFGFRRIGDLIWAAGDQRTRGFLIGATAGCSFPGEGLQHSDCTSQLGAGTVPNCRAYDPTYSYEVAVLLHHGVKEMFEEQQDLFYYITTTNENYTHPAMPEGSYDGIVKGMYLLRDAGKDKGKGKAPRVQLMAAGGSVGEALHAADLLDADFGVKADVWSCPSFSELSRDGFECERHNRLHPEAREPRVAYMAQCLAGHDGPVVAVSEYVRAVADQVHAFVPDGRSFTALGADGYGRSDTRDHLRNFFEVDRYWLAHAALSALAKEGKVNAKDVSRAIKEYKLDQDKPNPLTV
jgi:pyruvate dehydrogenase E1 component